MTSRLSPDQLRNFSRQLPAPIKKTVIGGVEYEIYRVKKFYSRRWENDVLYHLAIDARKSYCRYGDLAPLDHYDRKAAIYLIRAAYSSPPAEEWLSARFVPGNGEPHGIEDLDFYVYRQKPISHWVKKLFKKENTSPANVISISRLCGIDSYLQNGDDEKKLAALHSSDHLYTPVCFALLNKQMLEDYRNSNGICCYICAQIPDELVDGFLALSCQDQLLRPEFTPASETLNIPASEIKMVRNVFIHQFPLYFLNKKQMIGLIINLVKEGVLTAATIDYYFGKEGISTKGLLRGDHFKVGQFRNLGKLLISRGRVRGSGITGEQLRKLTENVADGPKLRMIRIQIWEKSIDRLIAPA